MAYTRIERYIFREILVPTLLSLGIFTFVLLAGRTLKLADLVISKGVPFADVVRLLGFLLPSFFTITIPLSVLLGTLLAFSRLSADAEIIAMKAAGISLTRLLKPTLLLAALATLGTSALVLFFEPQANHAFRSQVYSMASRQARVALKPRVFMAEIPGMVIYADRMKERTGELNGVMISDQRNSQVPVTIFADSGRLLSDPEGRRLTLALSRGQIHRYAPHRKETPYQVVGFSRYVVNLPVDAGGGGEKRQPKMKEIPLRQLFRLAKADSTARGRHAAAEIHSRFSRPLTPLLLALLALPLGIQSNRSGRGGGFAIGLVVFLCYYMLVSLANTLAIESGWPVIPTLWAPAAILLACGLVLFQRARQEKELRLLAVLQRRLSGIWRPHRKEV
ncbi:lipopolysaccharide export system permease protein [Geothermobacter ehrlichii]|uniref:Lipopolysaccharide export system permease protein n=1 Tax=Geothermobacter ehrlichii TaxID=213224 RepID=A0A5D3WKJ3_9BACT|nr:LPS export ABC transporter permease LptF [Geothermobacter ehrlichii]TYO99524.1 lipopolysaccharide export system permease protein [Geothermobacter ehrlichii]